MFVRFLVGVLAISAQRGRYHRFNTGTIYPTLITFYIYNLCLILLPSQRSLETHHTEIDTKSPDLCQANIGKP